MTYEELQKAVDGKVDIEMRYIYDEIISKIKTLDRTKITLISSDIYDPNKFFRTNTGLAKCKLSCILQNAGWQVLKYNWFYVSGLFSSKTNSVRAFVKVTLEPISTKESSNGNYS